IEAMKELRKSNSSIVLIIMSAYDKFDYAKEAINLNVLDYLNKPFNKDMIIDVLQRAMQKIDELREKRSNELIIREKIETVTPVIESGFIYSVLFQENYENDVENYKMLLGIEEEFGFMMVIEAVGEDDNTDENPVSAGIRIEPEYGRIREMIRGRLNCIVGPLLSNKIICYFSAKSDNEEYSDRVDMIEKSEKLVNDLERKTGIRFRVGIGPVRYIREAYESYKLAIEALQLSGTEVAHSNDLPVGCRYEEDYPIKLEKGLFDAVKSGNKSGVINIAMEFFDWMQETHPESFEVAKLKCLEFVLWAEHIAYESGGMIYEYTRRSDYLSTINSISDFDELKRWFLSKLEEATGNVVSKKEEKLDSVVETAKLFIEENYSKDISLDDVSGHVDVSPYYFTRLFKEETGVTFLEYLTSIRMDKARELMKDPSVSVKDICGEVGYADPNYFSRIFKKTVGITPTEYREKLKIF
nr:AraC family transcriptional regulator [Lachnospiraceae bacterium]